MKKRVLIACEESQAVTKAFRKLGIEAFSCDLLPSSGGHPEYHFQEDVFNVIEREPKFDLMVAHPPCTFLAISGSQWLSHPEDKHLPFDERRPNPKYPNRRNDMMESVEFVKRLYNCNIEKVAIENPIGTLSSLWMKPHQIIQPYMFGDEATKSTCLWLKNLPNLEPTNIVGKGEMVEFISAKGIKKRQPKWYMDILKEAKTPEQRRTLRSKTFQGIADAIAEQWSKELYK
jgi:hypothetical protein